MNKLKQQKIFLAVKIAKSLNWYYIFVSFITCSIVPNAFAEQNLIVKEPVEACVITREIPLDDTLRERFSYCLGWHDDYTIPVCRGFYKLSQPPAIADEKEIKLSADKVLFASHGRSELKGNVVIQQSNRIMSANTAYIVRDNQTNKITRIELINNIRYVEPDKLIIAKHARLNPEDKSGFIEDIIYRFSTRFAHAMSPAWGRASLLQRFPNEDLLLQKATYTTCPPKNKSWQIEAREIYFDQSKAKGIARDATLKIHDWPVLYSPYLSFPTTKKRKSGFIAPLYGYSNIGGLDFGTPYYWNMAPNYDSTIIPHVYSRRGLMMGGKFRFLTGNSTGLLVGNYLPNDKVFSVFLDENRQEYPRLQNFADNRWYILLRNETTLAPNLHFKLNYQQVSDDYYLQDFSSNLAVLTQNQLLRQADLTYTIPHWFFWGMMQSYQTLHPINQSSISNIYERLPQIIARGTYEDLPLNSNINIQAQLDNFRWSPGPFKPQGLRYHVAPTIYGNFRESWGYVMPEIQVVENNYDLNYITPLNFNRTIPRYSIDTGLTFERQSSLFEFPYSQTFEPRVYYLYVPFHEQRNIPNFDSAYMIFNIDQVFRNNRFSGFDRIGDTNQLSYALTSRWLSDRTGKEFANVSVGQIRYFKNRRVQLCYNPTGACVDDDLMLGYLYPDTSYSPIATHAAWQLNPSLIATANYIWDTHTAKTNNANVNLRYNPSVNHIVSLGYNYLVNGEITQVAGNVYKNNSLNQTTFAYAWPFTDRWSSFGVYSYNISKRYDMLTFLGVQYENCCWAFRVFGGRTFKNLTEDTFRPEYNSNFYVQIMLKGLASASSGDPISIIKNYLPGYVDIFH